MNKPNVLIFMTDQQRADSIFPFNKAKMPVMDEFCQESMTFADANTIAPHCCPSRATFFTGLYPTEHGVWNNVEVASALSRGFYEGVRTWTEDLNEAGYRMLYSGKWHVSNIENPSDRGFHEEFLFGETLNGRDCHYRPEAEMWEKYKDLELDKEREHSYLLRNGYPHFKWYGQNDDPFKDGTIVDDALEKMDRHADSDQPWCMYVGTRGPHDPYTAPQEFLDLYDINDIELPETFNDVMADKPGLYRKTRARFDVLTEQEQKETIHHYLALCSYEDYLFGKLLAKLKETGQEDNTIVIFLSDHGDYMASHGLWTKGLPCFKEAYHVPAVVKVPGVTKGQVCHEMVSLVDFASTILELTGVESEVENSGQSLVPLLREEQEGPFREALYTQTNGNEIYGIQRSITTSKWKLVYNSFDIDELYDLENDPKETKNLAEKPQFAAIRKALYIKLWQFAAEKRDPCINPYPPVALAEHGPGVAFL
ncbi:DUF4976 domain-containing protein [Photobacterium sanctipauli]|uniref:DUF4976 domain-containing protein n=1 Tax=Photobacterium sanctipauli TaxID=1342794 RepID=A0A2T3NNZ9_9GAMM|nr:sulfatase-like hydrolase/transferase [Photobacterium sanctipauli]PSW17989.1 DUF4976 domain-containing protein [Photobacterium sanctipauli]